MHFNKEVRRNKSSLTQKENMREFTIEELRKYDGLSGNPTYVALNGVVYDMSSDPSWRGGRHFGLKAGKDVSEEFKGCHEMQMLNNLTVMGVLKNQ